MKTLDTLINLIPIAGGVWAIASLQTRLYKDFDARSDLVEKRMGMLEAHFLAFQKEIITSHKYIEQTLARLDRAKN